MKTNFLKYSGLLLVSIILGFAIVAQVKIKGKIQEVVNPKKTSVLAQEVAELIKNNRDLLAEQKELQGQRDKLLSDTKQETEESLRDELKRFKIIVGATEVEGPGVEIKFDKFLQTVQLVDLVNALRNIGAEVISINNQRIIGTTGLDENNFSPPYTILVIGENHVMENALTRRGGIIEQIGGAGTVIVKSNLIISSK